MIEKRSVLFLLEETNSETGRLTNHTILANMENQSKGLGDTIEKITTFTGIKKLVEVVTEAVGIEDCGCEERRKALNEAFPYDNKEKQ